MYEYIPIEQAKPGDIVEYVGTRSDKWAKPGTLRIVTNRGYMGDQIGINDDYCEDNIWDIEHKGKILWKLLKTKPGSEAKVGDTIIRTENKSGFKYANQHVLGKLETVSAVDGYLIGIDSSGIDIHHDDCKVLCKVEETPSQSKASTKFIYPIYMKLTATGTVVKFTSEQCGEYIIIDKTASKAVGDHSTILTPHTNSIWEEWKPQFDYTTIMQSNTVVHCTTEQEAEELLLWAHQLRLKWTNGISVKLGGSTEWDTYKEKLVYRLTPYVSYGTSYGFAGHTILTMDEARNGKTFKPVSDYTDTNLPGEIGSTKEQPMDKPLLSDLLKKHGAYEKFLDNLSIGSPATYQEWVTRSNADDCVIGAFAWDESDYWDDISEDLQCINCINDVRAPDDVDYWQAQYDAGKTFFTYDPTDNFCIMVSGTNKEFTPPKAWPTQMRFYAERPNWLIEAFKEKAQAPIESPCCEIEMPMPLEIDNPIRGTKEPIMATTETSETTESKDNTMSTTITYTNDEIKAAMSGKKVKVAKVVAPKTDLQLAKKVTLEVEYFNSYGASEGCVKFTQKYAKAIVKAASKLRDADTRGWSMLNKNTGKITTEDIKLVTK